MAIHAIHQPQGCNIQRDPVDFFGSDNIHMSTAGRQHRRMALRGLKLVEKLLLKTWEQQWANSQSWKI
jgi:hypothetical protein